jgi:alcohol dehydrogenase class IV
MQAFEFFGVTRTVLGRGSVARLGELAAGLGRAALVVHNGPIGRVEELLGAAGVSGTIHRQRGEPVVADVDAAVDLGRRHRCDCVIGVGGGSALDVAKAAAGLLRNDGSVLDYMEVVGKGRKLAHPAAPWMAVPATAGTGAEATRNAVIGLPQKRFKASIRSEHLLARVALVDPELGVSVSAAVTASSGMDALCQLIESYTSSGASPVTDALALKGLGMAARNLPRVFHDGGDVSAREQMALAALLSGMTLTSAGLGAVHGLAAPLGANFPARTEPFAPPCFHTSSRPTSARCANKQTANPPGWPVMPISAANSPALKPREMTRPSTAAFSSSPTWRANWISRR